MKFSTLEEFINASMINKAKWLREAKVKDLATVMAKHPEFSVAVKKTIGQKGLKALDKAKLVDYETSLSKLMQIEFEPIKMDGESNYSFDINPSERSWFIQYGGKKLANNTSHKQLLKDNFPEDWDIFVTELSQINNTDKTDPLIEAEAEKTFTYRLLKTKWVKIGESGGNFYLDSYLSDKETKAIASYFAKSILKTRNIGNNNFVISNAIANIRSKYTVQELAELADI